MAMGCPAASEGAGPLGLEPQGAISGGGFTAGKVHGEVEEGNVPQHRMGFKTGGGRRRRRGMKKK